VEGTPHRRQSERPVERGQVGVRPLDERDRLDAGVGGALAGVGEHPGVRVHRHHLGGVARQGDGELAGATPQVEDAGVGVDGEALDEPVDGRRTVPRTVGGVVVLGARERGFLGHVESNPPAPAT
jgi:hypothetical protein